VFTALARRIRDIVLRVAVAPRVVARGPASRVSAVRGLLRDVVRSRSELIAENALLRQQLIVAMRCAKKPRFAAHERGLIATLTRLAPRWGDALLLVKPETILRWHRAGFRLFWRKKSRHRPPRPRISAETVAMIRRLAEENALWGAERVRGELLKLGVHVSKRTVQNYMRRIRGPDRAGQTWATFLENHRSQIWACDFLQLYDIWFRPIFAFFIIDLGSRRVVQVGVTRNPDTTWVAQQLRNATPCGAAPRFIIRDNDNRFGRDFDRAAAAVGVRVLRTAARAPKMNSYCERFLGSARRECLDHIFILG
jgi:putative transposase